jgi:methylase of polypeptide subunit release factors
MELDFFTLPEWVRKELFDFGYQLNKDFPKRFKTNGAKGLDVFYLSDQDGGGTGPGQDYIKVIKKKYPGRTFNKIYEWCSGPGFIAFNLLDHGLAKKICLSDIHNPALICAEETTNYHANSCKGLVSMYLLNDLALLPTCEQFDLVIAAPPHAPKLERENEWSSNNNRITTDYNWEGHKNFYQHIGKHLEPGGKILIQENHAGSTIDDFLPMIESGGLTVSDHFISEDYYEAHKDHNDPSTWPVNKLYYIEIEKK